MKKFWGFSVFWLAHTGGYSGVFWATGKHGTVGWGSAVKPSIANECKWASSITLQSKNYIKRTKYKASRREFIVIKNLDSNTWNQSRTAFEKVNETKWWSFDKMNTAIDSLEEPGGGVRGEERRKAREGSGADDQGKWRWEYHGFS